jgi:acetyl esterase/lipase
MHSWTELGTGEYLVAKPWMEERFQAFLQEGVDPRSPEVSPLFATELRGVAPAMIVTSDHDPLHDESEAYAEKLKAAGVPVDYTCWPGMIHGPVSLAGVVDAGKALIDQIERHYRRPWPKGQFAESAANWKNSLRAGLNCQHAKRNDRTGPPLCSRPEQPPQVPSPSVRSKESSTVRQRFRISRPFPNQPA